jgi:predicted transposase YbfD/YdcC
MDLSPPDLGSASRLRLLLDHLSLIEDAREPHRVAFPMAELLLLAVCGTIADCDDYDGIALWGDTHLDFLRRFLPFHHGVPGGRWLTIMMNRIDPALFSACFTSWVRACWPDRPELVAIDGKTSRRSHDRGQDKAPLHLVSAFATTSRLVLGQEAVAGKSNELTAIPALLERLAAGGGLKGAIVTIDAIACNGVIAEAVRQAGAHYLLAVKANQPTLRDEIELFFKDAAPSALSRVADVDKGHGRIETRTVTVAREVDWLSGERRFPGELRLPGVAAIVKVESKAELRDRCRFETRYYIASAPLSPQTAAAAIVATGGSKTSCIGCSTSSSTNTNPGCEKATAPPTWLSCATSPSIRSEPRKNQNAPHGQPPVRVASIPAPPRAKPASSFVEKSQDGTSNSWRPSSEPKPVNPDSQP